MRGQVWKLFSKSFPIFDKTPPYHRYHTYCGVFSKFEYLIKTGQGQCCRAHFKRTNIFLNTFLTLIMGPAIISLILLCKIVCIWDNIPLFTLNSTADQNGRHLYFPLCPYFLNAYEGKTNSNFRPIGTNWTRDLVQSARHFRGARIPIGAPKVLPSH